LKDEAARAKARENAAKRNEAEKMPTKEDFERRYVSKYQPNSRFMITVARDEEFPDHGVILAQYKTKWTCEIYVEEVEQHSPFYKTGTCRLLKGSRGDGMKGHLTIFVGAALARGDKILAINGKKHTVGFKTVQQAIKIIDSKPKITFFVMRPDPKDAGYQWIMQNT
jgi:hypothetical protein